MIVRVGVPNTSSEVGANAMGCRYMGCDIFRYNFGSVVDPQGSSFAAGQIVNWRQRGSAKQGRQPILVRRMWRSAEPQATYLEIPEDIVCAVVVPLE